ncbi:unnamed protein product [Ambrosiozyma monospora]|uniref:Unnamed protein product n=1 Tax=Ambrosiozyma monospora TaxID=43982 RepID=A0ACB5ST17_AMBMO|nr:unnamed protein product [Ambrosiozyma monospora]
MSLQSNTPSSTLPKSVPPGILLASQLPTEIQCIILKFVITRFLYFIHDTDEGNEAFIFYGLKENVGSVFCSENIQSQLLSMMRYDCLLDKIICMAIEELNLGLVFGSLVSENESFAMDEFIDFVSSEPVQLKSVELFVKENNNYYRENPKVLQVISNHTENVILRLSTAKSLPPPPLPPLYDVHFKHVSILVWHCGYLTDISLVLHRFQKLKTLFIYCFFVEIPDLRNLMEKIQHMPHPIERLNIQFIDEFIEEEMVAEYLVDLGDVIKENKNLSIDFYVRFQGIEISSRWRLKSTNTFDPNVNLSYPLSTKQTDKIEELCRLPELKYIALNAHSYPESLETVSNIRISRSALTSLMVIQFCPQNNITFNECTNLKRLNIFSSVVNRSLISNLPESLKYLKLRLTKLEKTSNLNFDINLPSQLTTLELVGNPKYLTLPKISNAQQLTHLKKVTLEILPTLKVGDDDIDEDTYDDTTNSSKVENTYTLKKLQIFIDCLPSHLESFGITNSGYIRANSDNHDLCCPDQLSFEHFTNLKTLEFNCLNPSAEFNISKLPSVDYLKFKPSHTLNGTFSPNILSLNVDLELYGESFTHFISSCISQFSSLLFLVVHVLRDTSIDFREVAFPYRLCSFKLLSSPFPAPALRRSAGRLKRYYGHIILDGIPESVSYFGLLSSAYGGSDEHLIVIDESNDETIASMRKKVHCTSDEPWIQYSHFDESESPFL